jgi:HipA-like protein
MLKFIKTFGKLWKTDEQTEIYTPKENVKFSLKYQNLTIGNLILDNDVWIFEYAEDFKKQTNIVPLTDFPRLDKVYESNELFPFFVERIPSLSQPKVKKIITEEKIDTNNEVQLLKRFGKTTITNPFQLWVIS